MISNNRRRILPKRLPAPQPMDAAEREYLRNLMLYQRAYVALLASGLNEIIHGLRVTAREELPEQMRQDSVFRMDANIEKTIRTLFDSVRNRLMELFPDKVLKQWGQMMVGHVNDISKKNVGRVASAVDIEIEPLLRGGKLNPFFNNVVDENVGLIRSIPDEKMPTLKNTLVSAITADRPQSDIANILQKNFKTLRSKASFISRDQVNKLNGKLNQYRQQQLGGERYIWRTSHDRRVRSEHSKLDGKMFEWGNPPIVDHISGRRAHPGQDFQCRCTAEMVLEDVID